MSVMEGQSSTLAPSLRKGSLANFGECSAPMSQKVNAQLRHHKRVKMMLKMNVLFKNLSRTPDELYEGGNDSSIFLKQNFQQLIAKSIPGQQEVEVPLGTNGCAFFSFKELWDKPQGAADYFRLFSK
ncbi:lactation elevated protein 1 [Cucumis melo var. makuwa]|uniref:Lactation elevated protein 1 n=1 Tax=Cucumis melo var. makuwa TaxID=1194695 RepID=A0A5A7VDI1_CUCMM|nr:lactation elevated protein 1 [Cucumis melo var. makuwa]TYK14449.1 lactation elevated protein 1 [Cucumis melo var. makuwa]